MKKNKTRKSQKTTDKNTVSELSSIVKGVIVSFIITLSIFIIYSLMLTYTQTTEKNIQLIVMITTVVSNLLGSLICTIRLNNKGLLYGSICGLIYAIIMLSISFTILPSIGVGQKSIIASILAIASGGIGGIIGINIKK